MILFAFEASDFLEDDKIQMKPVDSLLQKLHLKRLNRFLGVKEPW